MKVVVAPDKFKGSLTAPEVARGVASGLAAFDPSIEVVSVPVADGGEGTLDAAVAAGYELRTVTVTGPTGDPVEAAFAMRGDRAVVELARASGLDLLPGGRFEPLTATSRGTGQLVLAALDAGCRELVLGIGGSASTDGGTGLLRALGARLTDAAGDELPDGGAALARLAAVDLTTLDPRLAETAIVLASDVDNPLLGPDGAAAVFAPQKGASAEDVRTLDEALARFVDVLGSGRASGPESEPVPGGEARDASLAPGAGAAGGVGFAAIAVLGAHRRPGIDVVLELTGLAAALDGADAVITGEGSLDEQSLMGKTPIGVARLARAAGVPVYAVCGRTTLDADRLHSAGFAGVRALSDLESDPARSMAHAGELLERLAEELAADIVAGSAASDAAGIAPTGIAAAAAYDLVLRGGRVLLDGVFSPAEIGVQGGRVARVAPLGAGLSAARIVELAHDEVLIPGLVDTHVHVNEPGRTEWEGFASATRAAAAGGVTTIIDMPLNSIPPTTSVAALDVKRRVAIGQTHVDVGFWGGYVPGSLDELEPLARAGVFGFKCFLLHSGVDEFPAVTADELEAAMEVLAGLDSLLIVHAEDARIIDEAPHPHSTDYGDFLASRPRAAEDAAIADVIERAARTGARAHVLHLSSADSLDRIARAKRDGVALSVETCPHYLTLTAEEIPAGATAFKCCPPIREAGNRDALWRGLDEGTIDFVVSDHSPATPELKYAGDGDFAEAWGGIASLQLGLPLMWTEARRRGIALERVVGWMSTAPADRVGLATKGRIAVGAAADFAVFAPEAVFTVDAAALEHRHPVTPYDGRELSGVVRAAFLAGEPIDRELARGRLLRHGDA
ncbi:allantoinase AllB [Agromyces subbeticus]|uniref:allantoinase AllB n=1 Tax=Agromyces subbeticus TaxID=293890 RepID=UPI0003B48D70|nr:allantoinase AllB [Agromyces subbeticus]